MGDTLPRDIILHEGEVCVGINSERTSSGGLL